MSSFKPLNREKYLKTGPEITPETCYWRYLEEPTLVKEFGAIDYVDFSPVEPHYFAVTCSVRVQIYNPITKLVVKNLSRFQEPAFGGTFRQDGRLLAAGDQQGMVRLFDTSTKNVLRCFKGHGGTVRRTQFTADMLHIASFSDDKTVKLWDIATEKTLHTFTEHSDYVRAGVVHPVSTDVIMSGGYDGKINFYDTRTQQVSFSVNHNSPVESLLFLPTGGIFLSAGGTEVCVWDALAGGRLLARLSQHHKTVTCLRLASNGKRILSGGLDRHVKIYDVATYQVVHTLKFPYSVLSLGVAPKDQCVVAGMVEGLFSIQNMETKKKHTKQEMQILTRTRRPRLHVDHKIVDVDQQKLDRFNDYLRKYEYNTCLEYVMKNYFTSRKPEITVIVLQELIHRKGLHRALAGRSHKFLCDFIFFLRRYIGEHRFMRPLIDTATILLDVYEDSFKEFRDEVGQQFIYLAQTLQKEIELTHELLELEGSLEILMAASDVADDDETIDFVNKDTESLKQSAMAMESSILKV